MMRIVGGLLLCVLLGALTWLAAESAEGFEHWLNRYQTLLGAFIALAAAFIAAYPAWRQLQATAGNIDPEFWLDWSPNVDASPGDIEHATLGLANRNRRTAVIKKISLLQPRDLPFEFLEGRRYLDDGGEWQGDRSIPRSPHSDFTAWEGEHHVPSQQEQHFYLALGFERDTHKAGREESICVQVEYALRGEGKLRRTRVDGKVPRRGFTGRRQQPLMV